MRVRLPAGHQEMKLGPGIEYKQTSLFLPGFFCMFLFVAALFAACSFDYGDAAGADKSKPDIVMENLEYVRVRGGDPLARFQAEHAERWEERQTMELRNFSFEQMENHGETINAEGRAGLAVVQLDSGDISLKGGVRIRVDSEDVIIRTAELEWKDKPKTLSGREGDEVDIQRSDGTTFSGWGFFADARNRIWTFSGEVKGTYVEKDDEKKGDKAGEIETGTKHQGPIEITKDLEQNLPSKEEPHPVTEQPVPATEQAPEPAAEAEDSRVSPPEPKPVIPEPKPVIPEPKPVIPLPEPAAGSRVSPPDQYPEPKPSIPAPAELPPPLPEDK